MLIFVVQENGPNGIEGQPDYFTSEVAAQRAMAIKIFCGSGVSDPISLTMYEAWKFVQFKWNGGNMTYSEGEDEAFRAIFDGDAGIAKTLEEYEEDEGDFGNAIFECSVIETDELLNREMVGIIKGEDGFVKDYVYAGPDDVELFDRYIKNNGHLDLTEERK